MHRKLNLRLPCDVYFHLVEMWEELEPPIISIDRDMVKYLDENGNLILEEEWDTDLLILSLQAIKEGYVDLPLVIEYNGEIIYNGYFEYMIHEVAFAIQIFNQAVNERITEEDTQVLILCLDRIAPELQSKIQARIEDGKLLLYSKDKIANSVLYNAFEWMQSHRVIN